MKVSSPDVKNKQHFIRKSSYKLPTVHQSPQHTPMLTRTNSSSPPIYHATKSKASKSKRTGHESYDVPPIIWSDYVWLFIFYICLYVFFALFWYSLWSIYLMTKSDKPRYTVEYYAQRRFPVLNDQSEIQAEICKCNKTLIN